jgi:hypothetical protein
VRDGFGREGGHGCEQMARVDERDRGGGSVWGAMVGGDVVVVGRGD